MNRSACICWRSSTLNTPKLGERAEAAKMLSTLLLATLVVRTSAAGAGQTPPLSPQAVQATDSVEWKPKDLVVQTRDPKAEIAPLACGKTDRLADGEMVSKAGKKRHPSSCLITR